MRDIKQQPKSNYIELVTDIKREKVRDIQNINLTKTTKENKLKINIIIRVINDKNPDRDEERQDRNIVENKEILLKVIQRYEDIFIITIKQVHQIL